MTGIAKHTILRLLKDLGRAAASYHDSYIRNLRVRRVHADDVWNLLYGEDRNLSMEWGCVDSLD